MPLRGVPAWAAMNEMLPKTLTTKTEFAAHIYDTGDGGFSYGNIEQGTQTGTDVPARSFEGSQDKWTRRGDNDPDAYHTLEGNDINKRLQIDQRNYAVIWGIVHSHPPGSTVAPSTPGNTGRGDGKIRLVPNTPLTVPSGALLVVTGVGSLDELQLNPMINFNGQQVLDVRLFDGAERRAIVEVPPGLVAGGGTVVSCTGVLLGYLVRANEAPTFSVRGLPRPTEMVRIIKGSPLTVPSGKRFVVTGFGTTQGERTADIQIDGHLMLRARLDNTTGYVVPIPAGLTAAEGMIVEVLDNNATGAAVLLGYLADA